MGFTSDSLRQSTTTDCVRSGAGTTLPQELIACNLLDHLPVGVYTCDLEGRITYFNACAAELWGRSPQLNDLQERFCGSCKLFTPEGDPLALSQGPMAQILRGEPGYGVQEAIFERPNGSRINVLATLSRLQDREGQLLGAVGIIQDITDRKNAECAQAQAEKRFTRFMQRLPGLAWIKDLEGRYVFANSAAERAFRTSWQAIEGKRDDEFLPAATAAEYSENDQRALASGTGILVLESLEHPDGLVHRSIVSKFPLPGADGQPAYVGGIAIDITEHQHTEEALVRLLNFHETIIHTAAEGICVCYPVEHFPYVEFSVWNERMVELTGYTIEEINLLGWYQSMYPDPDVRSRAVERMGRMRVGEDLRGEEWTITRKDGVQRILAISTSLAETEGKAAVVALMQDVTERIRAEEEQRKLEAQILHAQKLESLGVLAGGIAHDFNNLLAAALGYADMASNLLTPDSPVRPMLREIELAAQRAAELAQQMLAYSGRGKFVIQQLQLNVLVEEMASLLKTVISRNATLGLQLQPAPVEGDATQIRQVIMNLITNASDALEGSSGTIRLSTGVRFVDRNSGHNPYLPEEWTPGTYAFVEVRDTGCGMTQDTLARIFDPFFSTKFTGRGLGLAAVLGIVRGHRGSITVESSPGQGTSFEVLLPACPAAVGVSLPAAPVQPATGGLILVIEDELTIRTLVRHILQKEGYRVLLASNGAEGLELFRKCQQEVAAILLDLTMPTMDGGEVLRKLRLIRPEACVLVMSGYSETECLARLGDLEAKGFIQKPFHAQDLVTRLNTLIAAAGSGT